MAEDRQRGHPDGEPGGAGGAGDTVGEDQGADLAEEDHPGHRVHSAAAGQHAVHGDRAHHPRLPAVHRRLGRGRV